LYGKEFNSHSIFFSVLAAHGFPGFIVFSTMLLCTFTSCARLKRSVRGRPDLSWIGTYADMIQVSLIAFSVNGMFVNMEYYDLVYHWVAVVCSLKVICRRALKAAETEETEPQRMLVPAVQTS
jgi:hypothetical protein